MLRIRHRETVPKYTADAPRSKMWPDVKEGLRWVVGHRWLRAIAACTGTSNFFFSLLFAIVLLYFTRTLHLHAWETGLVFAVGAVGSIVGALVVNRMQKRIGVGPTIVITAISFSVGGHRVSARTEVVPAAGADGRRRCCSASAPSRTTSRRSASARRSRPERLQGRMNAAMRWIVWGTIPLGSLAGGGIATAWGLRAALWTGAIGGLFTFLPVTLTSVRNIRELPEPVVEPTPAQAELAGGLVEGLPLPGPAAADA